MLDQEEVVSKGKERRGVSAGGEVASEVRAYMSADHEEIDGLDVGK